MLKKEIGQGGGGGASSWDELSDKPFNTIGEGLTTEEGKLKAKIKSVNGMTGDVELNADDVGTYDKQSIDAKVGAVIEQDEKKIAFESDEEGNIYVIGDESLISQFSMEDGNIYMEVN